MIFIYVRLFEEGSFGIVDVQAKVLDASVVERGICLRVSYMAIDIIMHTVRELTRIYVGSISRHHSPHRVGHNILPIHALVNQRL